MAKFILFGTRRPFTLQALPPSLKKPHIKDILETHPNVDMPSYLLNSIRAKYRNLPIIVDPDQPGSIAPTCVAHYAKDLGIRLVKRKDSHHGLRPFSIREYTRLQGFPDDFIFQNKRSSYSNNRCGVMARSETTWPSQFSTGLNACEWRFQPLPEGAVRR